MNITSDLQSCKYVGLDITAEFKLINPSIYLKPAMLFEVIYCNCLFITEHY